MLVLTNQFFLRIMISNWKQWHTTMENLRIGIIGNIGAGKSTLTEAMQQEPLAGHLLDLFPHREGDEKVYTYPETFRPEVLDAFYQNPKQYAFLAQIEFLNGRLVRQNQIEQTRGIVLEDRTIFEDYHIFGKAQKIMGHMSDAEFSVYQHNYNLMVDKIQEPNLVVYLRANTKTLLKRINKRGRDSEKTINPDYLELLNGLYETYIARHVNSPVLVVDANREKNISEFLEETVRKISAHVRSLDLRVNTPGLKKWVSIPETEATLRAVDAERRLEDYLHNNPKLITVAGNVGLGKTTVSALMHRSLKIKALYENPEKNPLLRKFLHNKKKYCFDLQKHFLLIRAEQRLQGKSGKHSYVKDRSLPEDFLVFCQQFHVDGHLSADELDILSIEFQKTSRALPHSDLILVLQGRPNLAWKRIQQRGREMEVQGGWSYAEIKSLNQYYKTYADDVRKFGFHDNPILEINVDKIDLTNRIHMGYLFEQTYEALQLV